MKKNQGMTLIELIMVIAIMGVLLGLVIPSLNALLGYEAQKAGEKLYSSIEEARTEAMSRLAGEMKLFKKDGSYYTTLCYSSGKSNDYKMQQQEPELIGNRRVTISYALKDTPNMWKPIDETGIILTYDRTTGGFRTLQSEWASIDKDNVEVKFRDTDKYCGKIKITGGLRTSIFTFNIESGTFQKGGA